MRKFFIRDKGDKNKYKSLGFYTVLALSIMAIGAAAWSASVGIQHIDRDASIHGQTSETPLEVDLPVSDQPAEIPSQPEESSQAPQEDTSSEEVTPEDKTVAHYFIMPVSGAIAKKYSADELQYSETYGDMRIHTGIDIAADLDSRVKSSGNGVVEDIYNDERTGNTIVINHGNGITAYYCGLNNVPMVSEGDVVLAGTDLGSVSTLPDECADAPHLHFAVKKDGEWTSPLALMNMEGFENE